MEFKSKCILLYSKPYRVADERTGEINEGISISYLMTENLNPYNEEAPSLGRGYKPCRDVIALDKTECLKDFPGMYDVAFSMVTNANGKPQMKISSIKFLNKIGLPLS